MKVALAQIRSVLGNKEANLDRMEEVASTTDADLLVFSELFVTGYMVRDEIWRLAERENEESVQRVARIADKTDSSILFGMAIWDDEIRGVLRNSALLVSPDGGLQRYDKVHLASFGPFEEDQYYTPGRNASLFDVNGMKMGAVICFDIFFPELIKTYALNGADLVVCLSASPITSRDVFEKIIPARAVENTIYFAYLNHLGSQLNQVFFGGSQAVGPRGNTLHKSKYFEEEVSTFDIESSELELARRMRPTLKETVSFD